MRIDPKDRIAGVPILAVRGFFNAVRGRLFSQAQLAEELGLTRQQAQALLETLLTEGYVEYRRPTVDSTPELHGPWRTTIKGDALAGGGSEPGTANEPKASAPHFPLVAHGYDPQLVDSRVAELIAQLDQERQRASELGQAAWATLVKAERERERVQAEAAQAAEQTRTQADRDAKATIDKANAQAAERIETAEEHAKQLEQTAEATLANAQRERERLEAEAAQAAEQTLSKAQVEAELAWLKASRERLLLQAEAERLAALREATVEQLQRMYTPLGIDLVERDHGRAVEVRDEDGDEQFESDQLEGPATASDAKRLEIDGPPQPRIEDENSINNSSVPEPSHRMLREANAD
jgi:hypothetical protein